MQALGRPCRSSNKLHPDGLGGPTRHREIHAGDDRGWAAPEPRPHCVTLDAPKYFLFWKFVFGVVVNCLSTGHNNTNSYGGQHREP